MRSIQRKLAVLGASALAMGLMAVGAGSAHATEYLVVDTQTGQPCPEVQLEGNEVSGGYLVEGMTGQMHLFYNTSIYYESLYGSFDIRIGTWGDSYAINQDFDSIIYEQYEECYQEGEKVPWALSLSSVEIEVCIQGPGQPWIETVPLDEAQLTDQDHHLTDLVQSAHQPTGIRDFEFENSGDADEVQVIEL